MNSNKKAEPPPQKKNKSPSHSHKQKNIIYTQDEEDNLANLSNYSNRFFKGRKNTRYKNLDVNLKPRFKDL